MSFKIDESLHWTEHYVQHGFCVIRDSVSRDFCTHGIEEISKALDTDLPSNEWATETLSVEHGRGRVNVGNDAEDFLNTIYDQPGFRNAIDTMFGSPDCWTGERHCSRPFVCVYDSENKPELAAVGHIDFVDVRVPVFGSGFVFQVSLVESEPFSGNITLYPGLHKTVQKRVSEDPGFRYSDDARYSEAWYDLVGESEPFEFVANPGDILFFHHLVPHAANVNAAAGRKPRVCIHGQVSNKDWPNEIDPTRPDLSPWERSLAHNGHIKLPYNEREVIAEAYRDRKRRLAAAAATGR